MRKSKQNNPPPPPAPRNWPFPTYLGQPLPKPPRTSKPKPAYPNDTDALF